MRRPVLFLAGLLCATGAGIALAAPAQAAPASAGHNAVSGDWPFGGGDEYNSYNRQDYDFDYDYDYRYNLDVDQKVNSCNTNNIGLTLISWTC